MTDRRFFNDRERAALYLAADGKCTNCGTDLQPGWHADHMDPHSRGGATDVINGQALCPACNLKKGNRVPPQLREWQRRAIEKFYARGGQDFLVCATPGAGKTTFALSLARQLLDTGKVQRVLVVVPTDALRQQWADAADALGISLTPVSEATDYSKAGYQGCVATYAQLSRSGAALARRACRVPTLAIIDEIHHAGDNRSWGDGLREAVDVASYRLSLTGTPWRRDGRSPIPYVTYDGDGKVVVDFAYEYGAAVADGVCRRIEFHAYGGDATWHDPKLREPRTVTVGADMEVVDVSMALETIYQPSHEWTRSLLNEANVMLDDLRTEIQDAGGLVIAERTWMADEYARILQDLTGTRPPVVVSDEDDPKRAKEAKATIDRFRSSRERWIVAVKMISEGVDIPRLAVGVYASKIQTPLFFRQVVGRFVRIRPGEEFNSMLFMPNIPDLAKHAKEIEEELRHQLDLEAEREARERPASSREQPDDTDLRRPLFATEAMFDRAILGGEESTQEEMTQARQECIRLGIPVQYALNLIPLLRLRSEPRAETPPQQKPRHRRESMLRKEVDALAGKLARQYASQYDDMGKAKKAVNAALLRKFGVKRDKMSVEQLEVVREYLLGQLS